MVNRESELLGLKLENLGYSTFHTDRSVNLSTMIKKILRSNERRYWKAIPFLIERSVSEEQKGDIRLEFDINDLIGPDLDNKNRLLRFLLLTISYEIIEETDESAGLKCELRSELEQKYDDSIKSIERLDPPNDTIIDNYIGFRSRYKSAPRFESLLKNIKEWFPPIDEYRNEYLMQRRIRDLEDRRTLEEQRMLESERRTSLALARLFPKKQRDIIRKIVMHEPLSKTEYEYYIRTVKKKLRAINTLSDLSSDALAIRPLRSMKGSVGLTDRTRP